MFKLEEEPIKAKLTQDPKQRPNLSEWMCKHNIGTNHTSLSHGIKRAIESQDNI